MALIGLNQGVGQKTGSGYYLIVFGYFLLVLLSFAPSCPLSLFLSD